MTTPNFGPKFTFGTHDTLADSTVVHAVTVRHFAAQLERENNEEDELAPPEPVRHDIGLVWESKPLGWCASPPVADWAEATERAVRSFPDRETAAMFLYGFDAAVRWQKYRQALAAMPWRS